MPVQTPLHELYRQDSIAFAVEFEAFTAQRSTPSFSASIADTIQHFPRRPHPGYPDIPPYYVAPPPVECPEGPLFCVYANEVHCHRPYDVWDYLGPAQNTCADSTSSSVLHTKKRQLSASDLEADDF